MDDKTKDNDEELKAKTDNNEDLEADDHSDYKPVDRFDAKAVHHLSGMYKNWFLDYASYVILERAVPHIGDGLKPVQRRILHSMKRMDDGRYIKVANIVGHTMQFHPHGDASIGEALVQLGQKNLLIDTQGNWGNILTGDRAAAPRYIEARLSKFALETVFNPKTTEWQMSYDGRNKEPITLPVKYPLLLAQGAEGIAVGLSCKIMPHNFNEICDAAVSYLRGEPFHLYPDFPTGGAIDVSKYNDGQRGGVLKVRAKIEKVDNKTLAIREIPYSKTTSTLIESITKAVEKGKIKARKIEDNTAAAAEILIHLAPGTSSDKTIDALYAFSDCEINIMPNCCVIEDDKPQFLTISDVLRHSADRTMGLLRRELQIRKGELEEQLFFCSLEKIFIEERIYKERQFEQSPNLDATVAFIDKKLEPFKKNLLREVTRDDILRLLEIKMQRILKFNKDKADELMARIRAEIDDINRDLGQMVEVTVSWFTYLKEKYGKEHPRLTEIRNFDTIEAAKVAEANQKLYINRKEGFIGTGLKKDEFVCNCSDIDDVIVFYRTGKFKVIRVADKIFVGKNVLYVNVYKRNDQRTIYNCVYRDGAHGNYYIKRFNMPSCIRDREYDLTRGEKGSWVFYFSANSNGEAEVIKITLDPDAVAETMLKNSKSKAKNKMKVRASILNRPMKLIREKSFAEVPITKRGSHGLLLSKIAVQRITMKSAGHSTLGGRKVWFDPDVKRLNYDDHGTLLGEFFDDDQVLVILQTGEFYVTTFDANNHFEDNIYKVEKFDSNKVWTAAILDADNGGYLYIKRFLMEAKRSKQTFAGENKNNQVLLLTDTVYPRINVVFGGVDASRPAMEIDAEQFIGVKGFKAKGKRVAVWQIDNVEELEPTRFPEPEPTAGDGNGSEDDGDGNSSEDNGDGNGGEDNGVSPSPTTPTSPTSPTTPDDTEELVTPQQLIDRKNGQLDLFDNND